MLRTSDKLTRQRGFSRLLITAILLGALCCIAAYAAMQNWLQQPLAITSTQTIEFKSGSSISAFAAKLKAQNILEYPRLFSLWTRLQYIDTRLKAGEYELHQGDTLADLLDKMLSGDVKQYSITFIEGWNFKQLLQALAAHPQLQHTIEGQSHERLMASLGLENIHPEGQFLPDTYFIHRGTTDIELLQRANKALQEVLQRQWTDRQADLPLQSAYEALILASIIEKETAVGDERPIISGVFINRLRKGMRLQTDPTVIYGMGDEYQGDIRFRDLRRDTPYNTYTRKGLPPTPIAMAGEAAIRAAVHPAETEYLYFVASSDGSGRHLFSSTLEQHEKKVDIHQRGK